MPTLKVHEAERGFIDYTLRYGPKWSKAGKRNTPVLQTDTAMIYFFVKKKQKDVNPVITLSSADATEIEWVDPDEGKIRVKLGIATEGYAGNNYYELRVKFTDNSFVTGEDGKLTIRESIVDTP